MSDDPYEVDVEACRSRQQRLLAEMVEHGLEWVLLTRGESVQWLTGAYVGPLFAPAAAMNAEGRVTLVLPSRKTSLTVAADEVLPYEEKWHSTLRDEQRAASSAVLMSALPLKLRRVGGEWSQMGPDLLADCEGKVTNIEPVVFRLRRQKDNDELCMLRRANDANQVMYALAREIVRPGVNELEVYNALHAAAVQELGEALTYFGQDFRSNARGGLPRDRRIEAGDLYILDLGVGFRGYYSDNARTIAVGGEPSEKQVLAWERVTEVFPLVESTVRPGVSCKQLFQEVQDLLDRSLPWVFNHHLGHGVGLAPHEGPHLNPNWDDTFLEGEFFTAEPGLYHEELCAGVRLEENYVVTASGCEKLTDYPLGL
ncbi:M24 family metallopeptidase [Bythopirellula goksoeyrii]|uniref:Putative peptidase n=1 Tax=Bythopirellula goksoeyrii TaxID=1400387 RepID=A0A5B9QBU9_9BACT|nr:Xaa-Pro peptidase family protein [Bythopirellula goksoeyrii]QEG36527.1 putative peptidase [Bythopirellula goksoeyrii]